MVTQDLFQNIHLRFPGDPLLSTAISDHQQILVVVVYGEITPGPFPDADQFCGRTPILAHPRVSEKIEKSGNEHARQNHGRDPGNDSPPGGALSRQQEERRDDADQVSGDMAHIGSHRQVDTHHPHYGNHDFAQQDHRHGILLFFQCDEPLPQKIDQSEKGQNQKKDGPELMAEGDVTREQLGGYCLQPLHPVGEIRLSGRGDVPIGRMPFLAEPGETVNRDHQAGDKKQAGDQVTAQQAEVPPLDEEKGGDLGDNKQQPEIVGVQDGCVDQGEDGQQPPPAGIPDQAHQQAEGSRGEKQQQGVRPGRAGIRDEERLDGEKKQGDHRRLPLQDG